MYNLHVYIDMYISMNIIHTHTQTQTHTQTHTHTQRERERERERERLVSIFRRVARFLREKKGAVIDANDISRRRREDQQTP